jgi:hypothetical protein
MTRSPADASDVLYSARRKKGKMTNHATGTALALRGTSSDGRPQIEEDEGRQRLQTLPPEIGVLLILIGTAGVLLPGPVGTPFLIAGGISLWPKAFNRLERWFQRRCPTMHSTGMEQILRYLDDLERRYPGSTTRE